MYVWIKGWDIVINMNLLYPTSLHAYMVNLIGVRVETGLDIVININLMVVFKKMRLAPNLFFTVSYPSLLVHG